MSLYYEYISFNSNSHRTQGDFRHLDLSLRTPALQSLVPPGSGRITTAQLGKEPSLSMWARPDSRQGRRQLGLCWSPSHPFPGRYLLLVLCVKWRPGKWDRTAWRPLYDDNQILLNSPNFKRFLLMPFTLLLSLWLSPGSSAIPLLPDLQNPKYSDQVFMCRTNK